MQQLKPQPFFQKTAAVGQDFIIGGSGESKKDQPLTFELNAVDSDLDCLPSQLTDGQNVTYISDSSGGKRDGINLYGQLIGNVTGILGGFSFINQAGTQEQLAVYNTGIYRLVSGIWTLITGATLTTALQADGVYFPFTDSFYITNGTDTVVTYQAGSTSAVQTSTLPKGKYITTFQNRLLVANVPSYPGRVYYSDAEADTLTNSLTQWFQVDGIITGVVNYNNQFILIFTNRAVYRLNNFYFDGTDSWAQQLYQIPTQFGAIYERTIAIINNKCYFLGQDTNNIASGYVTDGATCSSFSYGKIRNKTKTLNGSNLAGACAVGDGYFYRIYVPELTQTTNNIGLVYDTVKNIFLTNERRILTGMADFSCLWTAQISGVWTTFGGSSVTGRVYKIHGNAGMYDELAEEQYLTLGSTDESIASSTSTRVAQSFKLGNYNITQFINVTQASLYLKTVSGTNTQLTVRIETDNAGAPSGTLVNANATATIVAASVSSSYSYIQAVFTTPFALQGNTTYWLVIKHTTEATGNSVYAWLANASGTYAHGNTAIYASSAWTAVSGTDQNFALYLESPIDAYFDTKGFLANNGRYFRLTKFQAIFSNPSQITNMEISFSDGSYGFNTYFLNLALSSSQIFGTAAEGGSNDTFGTNAEGGSNIVFGGQQLKAYPWQKVDGFSSRMLKVRIRNRYANQPFEFNKINCVLVPQMRDI